MKWDVHIYHLETQSTETRILDVPEAENRNDVRLVYRAAEEAWKIEERYMLATPHVEVQYA